MKQRATTYPAFWALPQAKEPRPPGRRGGGEVGGWKSAFSQALLKSLISVGNAWFRANTAPPAVPDKYKVHNKHCLKE